MAFQKLGRRERPDVTQISIEPARDGRVPRVRLSAATMRAMGEPVAVFFEWDADDSLLRVVASSPDDPASYRVGRALRASVHGLLEQIDVHVGETTAFPATPDGPLAVIADLSDYRSTP